jgi:hypothetical protein
LSSYDLFALDSATGNSILLSENSYDWRLTVRSNGFTTFVDQAFGAWFARLPGILPPVRIDGGLETTEVLQVGETSNRAYFTMRRTAGHDDVAVLDLDTRTVTTLLGGPADDTGFFFPN